MTPSEKTASVYAKLHENRYEHIFRARRERDLITMVYALTRDDNWLKFFTIFGSFGFGFAIGVAMTIIAQ
jgi:hypothetical protein